MSSRTRLCAIAKDEGAYLVDWVFHHLYFGLDEIEVWINATSDTSVAILETISGRHPEVSFRVADSLLSEALSSNRNFQHLAYLGMAERAARSDASHVLFLDIDEYWVPLDFQTPLRKFLPTTGDVNVVSFPWALDVPDLARDPFAPVFEDAVALQLDRHVKSAIRPDERVEQYRTHTARTSAGTRLLIDRPFPILDEVEQQWGSRLPAGVTESATELPTAFILHAINRSQQEYLAALTKGNRQTGVDGAFKTNRAGYLPTAAPLVWFRPESSGRLRDYETARRVFWDDLDVHDLVDESRRQLLARARWLLDTLIADDEVLRELRFQLRGVSVPELDECQPHWDARLVWRVSAPLRRPGGCAVTGWAFGDRHEDLEFAVVDGSGRSWVDPPTRWAPRADVVRQHPQAPPECGFTLLLPPHAFDDGRPGTVSVRPRGRSWWDVAELSPPTTEATA